MCLVLHVLCQSLFKCLVLHVLCSSVANAEQDWNHPGSTINVETDDPRHEQLFPCGAESVFYFVWFPLTECKVLSASRRLFSLLWSRVAALEAAAKRLVLQILNWKNLPGVQVFLYVLSSLYVLFCLNPRKYWIERISQGSRFLFMFFIRYMSYSV